MFLYFGKSGCGIVPARSVAVSQSKLLAKQLGLGELVDQSCAILRRDLRGYPVLRKLLHSDHRQMDAKPNEISRRYLA
jgi:hypothetical protein